MKTFYRQDKVLFEDVDLFETVYHVTYFKYLDRARNSALSSVGLGLSDLRPKDLGVLIYEISSKFVKPAKLDDELHIYTRVPSVVGPLITIEHSITLEKNDIKEEDFKKFKNVIHTGSAKAVIMSISNKSLIGKVPTFIQEGLQNN